MMGNNKTIARIVGILFIIGTAAGIASAISTFNILNSSDYLKMISENETMMIIGALLVMIMALSLSMIPVVLYPIFRKYNEILALGAVLFRGALEAVAYIAIVLTWLALVSLSREFTDAGVAEALIMQNGMGDLLMHLEDWITHILAIVFSLGALMIYWLFYVSRLIPKWLSVWGLVGAVLYLFSPLIAMLGIEGFGVLMAPLAIQEMTLALWLIIKGFTPGVARKHSRENALGA